MASNVSNLLKEKIVTPVANSLATQVDNKVKNGIILRKFIGVQLGESNTGCQLVKIDLNKINVKDPSYEFTLYIKAFSQKGLFNFIINVNKTDSLQVDVKCEVKNSDSNNGEAIGYYDVDAVGNTITISLLKAFVVNTSINECKFVSTKDTLNISDLDIDWSDTGNVKNDTSINIKGKESNIEIDVDKYLSIDCGTLGENQRYRIATIDYSKLSEAKYFDGTSWSPTIGNSMGCFVRIKIASNLLGMMILEIKPLLLSRFDISSAMVILESKGTLTFSIDSDKVNIDAFLYKRENKSIQIFYNNDLFSTTSKDTIHVFSCEIISLNAKLDPDTIKVTFDMDTTTVTDTLNGIQLENGMNLYKVFTTNVNSIVGSDFNGLVPGPNKTEAENKYLLGADAKWHPRKTGNEYIVNLKPTEEIKGLSETDTTKGISFVTFDFNTLSQKVVESAPSTDQEFMIHMKALTRNLGIITISTKLSITANGLIGCSGVLSDRGMGSNSVSFSTTYSGKLGAVVSPGFFVNDTDTKILKIALYTPIAIDGVKIIDAGVTSYSDIIDESDIVFTWELGILEKKPYKPLRSNIIYPRIDLDRELVFDQMNIETPISETDEDTLFAEQIKHNGLVPAPGKYEVNNGYYLKADGTWDLPKNSINDYIALVTPSEEMADQTGTTTGVSFVTIDYSKAYEKLSLGTNETTGFRLYLTIFNETYGKLEISLRTIIVNLGENINQGVIAYADIGTEAGGLSLQLVQIQNNYGEDIRTPIFTDIDPTTYKIRVGIYAVGINKPVIVKNCTIHQTHDTIDTHDIDILWEANVVTFSEENTKSASQYTNINLNKTFTPIINMRDPEGSYSESQVRRWRLENNGFVPAPAKYEADQGRVLCADGSWIPTRGNNNAISRNQLEASRWSEIGTTKAVSFVTIDFTDLCAQFATLKESGSFNAAISMDLMISVLGKIHIDIFIYASADSIGRTIHSDIGTGYYSPLLSYYLYEELGKEHLTPGFSIVEGKTLKLAIYGSYGTDMINVIDCTAAPISDVVLDINKLKYNWEITVIDIPEDPDDFELGGGVTRNTVFKTNNYYQDDAKLRNGEYNGLVPAPRPNEEDHFLKGDGTWASANDIMNTITTNPEDEGKILKAHNGSVIWASLINGEEVGY